MPTLPFTVDSALLQELGERLVGKPHVALAELIKNSYDADANQVTIEFAPGQDRIEVRDDGHGMDLDEFKNYWMRIGSQHKHGQGVSRRLKRPLTGSKGVGRLAVQFLAHDLELETVSSKDRRHKIQAQVDWDTLVTAGELTKARVAYEHISASGSPFQPGTRLILKRLKHEWSEEEIRGLAKEIWWLQPPFRSPEALRGDDQHRFYVEFISPQEDAKTGFDQQMRAIVGIWTARLVGKNEKGQVDLSLEFAGQHEPISHRYRLADFQHNRGRFDAKSNLNGGDFEIRIFKLQYKQPHGIAVEDAREYFRHYGGVHVYDSGFRLPYYGNVENDWLRVQLDHARRISKSDLLPESLQVDKGLTFLPTLSRVFGVVNVNTAREPKLEILVTRDRLRESMAFDDLVSMVRYALDFYAQHEAGRAFQDAQSKKPIEPSVREVEALAEVLERHEDDIPKPTYKELKDGVRHAAEAATRREKTTREQIGVLGPLATAGISALAYQHEIRKQFVVVQGIITTIQGVKTKDRELKEVLEKLSEDLTNWLDRAAATNALFDYFADAENVQIRRRFRALTVVEDVVKQMRFLARGAEVTTEGIDAG